MHKSAQTRLAGWNRISFVFIWLGIVNSRAPKGWESRLRDIALNRRQLPRSLLFRRIPEAKYLLGGQGCGNDGRVLKASAAKRTYRRDALLDRANPATNNSPKITA